jgi:uncharacterized protein (DUF1778 family)
MPARKSRSAATAATARPVARIRITMRMPKRVRARLEEAAELAGTTVGRFMVEAALKKADDVLEQEGVIRLSKRDAARLLKLLDDPPPPNARLRQALDAHRRMTGGDRGQPFEWPPRTSKR